MKFTTYFVDWNYTKGNILKQQHLLWNWYHLWVMIKVEMKSKWICLWSVFGLMETRYVALVLKSCSPIATTVTWVKNHPMLSLQGETERGKSLTQLQSWTRTAANGPPEDSPALIYSFQLGRAHFKQWSTNKFPASASQTPAVSQHAGEIHFIGLWCPTIMYGARSTTSGTEALTFQHSDVTATLCSAKLVVWCVVQCCDHEVSKIGQLR